MNVFAINLILILMWIIGPGVCAARNEVVKDIYWIYYSGKTLGEYKKYPLVSLKNVMLLKSFKSRSKTVFYIHDYEQSAFVNITKTFVQAYLTARKDTNVIVLDWSNLSKKGFLTNAASNTDMVGRAAGTYLLDLIGAGFEKKNLHIVGYSLGCHIAGAIGRRTKVHGVTLNRITGLDCALAGYLPQIAGTRLSSNTALFVDTIHTDSSRNGIPTKISHADFWPNGGYRNQPGCQGTSVFETINAKTLENEQCSHMQSVRYYAESVMYPNNFIAVKCKDYDSFKKNFCGDKSIGYMGYAAISTMQGNFYLVTSKKQPYGMGKKGITSIPK